MRCLFTVLFFVCLFPAGVLGQQRITKVMVGPYDDQIRIVAAFIEPSDAAYKMQSMIIDLKPIKNNQELPASVFVDLTSTVRSLSTGEKKQKILQLRWKKSGEIEFKCDGKWIKKDAEAGTNKIIEAAKAIFQVIPLNSRETTEITLKQELEEKIISVLNSLETENYPCLRALN